MLIDLMSTNVSMIQKTLALWWELKEALPKIDIY